MTRSIPSIIVLALMCFTISYGLVRFPEAGILDAAQSVGPQYIVYSSNEQKTEVLKPTADGSALQVNDEPSPALEEPQASPEDLFVTQPTAPLAEETVDSNSDAAASEKSVNNASENKKKKSNGKNKSNKKPVEPKLNESESPKLESEPVSSENSDPSGLIGIPDGDQAESDDSMPIETDKDPLPKLDKTDADIPSIFVDNNPLGADPEPLSDPEPPMQEEPLIPEMTPEEEKSVDDYWNTVFNENEKSNKDKSQTDGVHSEPEKKSPKTTQPTDIKTDPNAQEIPAKNREQKPANQDALTLPALDEPQNDSPSVNLPDTGTIPLESFPLDASATQKVNYTVDYQQEPYDPFGFNIPETGEIIVKRLPPIENSVDPIYNNAQLDRFAL